MVVLVTGGSGQLGQALQSIADGFRQLQFRFLPSSELDITSKESIRGIFDSVRPDWCINAAAYTAVDKAESEPDKAAAINVGGARNIAEACRDSDVRLIHISTDFVFDGNGNRPYREDDKTGPQSVYGKTKLGGEQAIAEIFDRYFIVRTAWVYSQFGHNFMKTMLRLAREKDEVRVVADQVGTPTHAVDLAHALLSIVSSGTDGYGIYHFSNEGTASWFDFAKRIFEVNQIATALIPIATSDFPTPAKRPAYSVLDKGKIKSVFGLDIRDWRDAVTRFKT
jgi:dTDP-4-dehydrorhamnose reductase